MRSLVAFLLSLLTLTAADYETEIEKWRAERESKLKARDGWLSLAGLFWLRPGDNTVGSDPDSRVKLSAPIPKRAAVLTLEGDKITFRSEHNDTVRDLKANSDDFVSLGGVKLFVIHRGVRYGARIKDNNVAYRKNFTRLDWYPVDARWRITARYKPFAQPRKMSFDSETGDKQEMIIPGVVEFTRGGKTYTLSPALEENQLFFVFRDRTAGKTTYEASRFLYANLPSKPGTIELDFNKAYNPPCVFTPYATCPLPPRENRLEIEVGAGEKKYPGPKPH